MAEHSLAKLTKYVIEALDGNINIETIHLWSESEIVLAWISKPSYHWKTFVKNRVQEIHDTVSLNAWRYCLGTDNPADMHSRGISLVELRDNDSYWHGPEWLKRESDWPCNDASSECTATEDDAVQVMTIAAEANAKT